MLSTAVCNPILALREQYGEKHWREHSTQMLMAHIFKKKERKKEKKSSIIHNSSLNYCGE